VETQQPSRWSGIGSEKRRRLRGTLQRPWGPLYTPRQPTGDRWAEVGPDVAPRLRQYLDWLATSKAEILATEFQCWNLGIGYAGTADLLVRFPDQSIWLVDLKTGKGVYGEHALQLLAYLMAEFVGTDDVVDETTTEYLKAATGLAVLHLEADKWEFPLSAGGHGDVGGVPRPAGVRLVAVRARHDREGDCRVAEGICGVTFAGRILSIDPGSERSAWLLYESGQVLTHSTYPNDELLELLRRVDRSSTLRPTSIVIEWIESYGMPVGREVFETVWWAGRFTEAAQPTPVVQLPRRDVKLHLCGSPRAKT
jgi:hypothetical protein